MIHNATDAPCELPGNGHVYGNFDKYYSFHPPQARMSLIIPGMFKQIWESQGSKATFFLLDIGCNEGDLSIEVYHRVQNELPEYVGIYLLGIDIDQVLIEKAKEKHRSDDYKHCTFIMADVMKDTLPMDEDPIQQYMKKYTIQHFSFTSLFSVTMWIHVNYGNDLFYAFLRRMCGLSVSLLIEPQPWKCYRSAKKRCVRNAVVLPKYLQKGKDELESRAMSEDIIRFIINNKLKHEGYWCLGVEEWGRPLLVFHDSYCILQPYSNICTTNL
jgi:SAM-dependent methyltransferase